MKKVMLAIISPAILALGLLGSTTAISDDAKVDDVLIAQGNGEQMACWGKLHLCLTTKNLPSPFSNHGFDDFICETTCAAERVEDKCTLEVCIDRCNTAYATNASSGSCDTPPEFASLMDLLKKSPAVESQPEEAEAEPVDST